MSAYPIRCLTRDCTNLAEYKIASRWSDGVTSELKTYSLCCADCLPTAYQQSKDRKKACWLTAGESVEAPGIYRLNRGQRDVGLQRMSELEAKLNGMHLS